MDDPNRIAEVHICADTLPVANIEQQHERRVAVFDLLEDNSFKAHARSGPYVLRISLRDGARLDFLFEGMAGQEVGCVTLALHSLRRVIKDYFLICESYNDAIRTGTPAQIEAIDMGRRGLHNEGSRQIEDALGKIADLDFLTARRLFTLVCALHRRAPA